MKNIYRSSVGTRINPQKLEKIKISFLFSFILLISSLFGILIANCISKEIYTNALFQISNHFETIFLRCYDFVEYAKIIAFYSLSDIISLLIIFAVSFSVVNYLATDIVLFYSGIKFGVATAFLINLSKAGNLPYSVGWIRLSVFLITELSILALTLYYSYQAAISSASFKRIDTSGRPNIKTRDFLIFTLRTAACIGAIFILNAVYCFLLYILK